MFSLPPLAEAVIPQETLVNGLFVLVLLVLVVLSLRGYARVARRLPSDALWLEPLGPPDVLTGGILALWLGGMSLRAFLEPRPESQPVTDQLLVQNALFLGIIVLALAGFLQWRRIPVFRLFGLGAIPWRRAAGKGLRLIATAYPLIFAVNLVMFLSLEGEGEQQAILTFFRQAVAESNHRSLLLAAATGVIIAPLAEEFLFRGYLYGTLRRYLTAPVAIALNAALFALIHANLMALPALFVLAICLCLAYEATGSLWVPVVMHLVFNFITLAMVYLTVASGMP